MYINKIIKSNPERSIQIDFSKNIYVRNKRKNPPLIYCFSFLSSTSESVFLIHFEEIWTLRISLQLVENLHETINIPWIFFCICILILVSSDCWGSFQQISIFWLKLFCCCYYYYYWRIKTKLMEIFVQRGHKEEKEKSLKIIKCNTLRLKRFYQVFCVKKYWNQRETPTRPQFKLGCFFLFFFFFLSSCNVLIMKSAPPSEIKRKKKGNAEICECKSETPPE